MDETLCYFSARYRRDEKNFSPTDGEYNKYLEVDIKEEFISIRLCTFPGYYIDEYGDFHRDSNPSYYFISEGKAFRIGGSSSVLALMGSAIFILRFREYDVKLITVDSSGKCFRGFDGYYKIWNHEYDINDAYCRLD